ncbi:hypothetical protein LB579_34320, partial [Mesorhizobium sp. BR1-1-7]|uniref:hypothetical protein n=1 Tax=Mesorhizobium sp. BR1-1-7 TaxID=2876647 RepID=UPI001CCC8C5D
MTLTEDQIKHMVQRFLQWRLPENFNPDGGISFKAAFNEHTAHPMKFTPVGTNLFDAAQATAMVMNMVAGMPASADYDQGRRDVLNAILALNPKVAQKLHTIRGGTDESFTNHDGQLPFDVVLWVTEVAEQLGIEPAALSADRSVQ